jgi:CAAX protease family protein
LIVHSIPVASRRRFAATLALVLAALVAVNVLDKFGPAHTGLVLGPAIAVLLIVLARRHGLSWDDLGLARRSWLKGAGYALAAVLTVAAGYGVAAAIPATRTAFLDARYHLGAGPALLTALVVIPLGTVLIEEVAFRGVLQGLLHRHHGALWATGLSSALFGLWHILPSLRLSSANHAAASLFGGGGPAQWGAVAAVVVFTAAAGVLFCELRRRSGSLLASAGLHWATNGVGVLLAAVVWAMPAMHMS